MMPKVDIQPWGRAGGEKVSLITFRAGPSKGEVLLTNYGARLVSVKMPDREGAVGEITLGYDTFSDYFESGMNFGTTIGRVVNRIAWGEFELDGETIALTKNKDDLHHVHGGVEGFDKKVWNIEDVVQENDAFRVTFGYSSPDGEEGYPGTLDVQVSYHISENAIAINYTGSANRPTIVNLTNHAYWNLAGPGITVAGHEIMIAASHYVETSEDLIPTGELASVDGTPLDFREVRPLREAMDLLGGVDHNFVLDKGSGYGFAARASDFTSGRVMSVETDQPVCVGYTGNYLEGTYAWRQPCVKHQALCLETQQFPDAVHHPNFPSIVLRPGETYRHTTRYVFTIEGQS